MRQLQSKKPLTWRIWGRAGRGGSRHWSRPGGRGRLRLPSRRGQRRLRRRDGLQVLPALHHLLRGKRVTSAQSRSALTPRAGIQVIAVEVLAVSLAGDEGLFRSSLLGAPHTKYPAKAHRGSVAQDSRQTPRPLPIWVYPPAIGSFLPIRKWPPRPLLGLRSGPTSPLWRQMPRRFR
jgi:hypothetical protein